MKIVAIVNVDLERAPLGTRSRLAEDLRGKPVLRRTLERILRAKEIAAVHVLARQDQAARVNALIQGLNVVLETHAAGPPPYQDLVRASRIWGLDTWRGGIGSLCVFDEDFNTPLAHAIARKTAADGILSIPAAAVLVDPMLLDALIRHYRDNHEAARVSFIQAPPGLTGFIIDSSILSDLTPTSQPPGALLVYQPDRPSPDAAGKEACYRPHATIVEARSRLLYDTRRSMDVIRDLFAAGADNWDAMQIAQWLHANQSRDHKGAVSSHQPEPPHLELNVPTIIPQEIEIELTTHHPLSTSSLLRPRGTELERQGSAISLDVIRAVTEWIADYDDVQIVLGGFGDPLLHPQFAEVCRLIRQSSAAAIAVRTSALSVSPEAQAALFETPVDVIEVMLDAARPETYRALHGADGYATALARTETWLQRRRDARSVLPLIVPSMIKCNETMQDLEPFVDHWQRRLGACLVTGASHYAGQRDDRAVTSMVPPRRDPCRRVRSRAFILADGRMTTCDQDFAGRQALGAVTRDSIRSLWSAPLLQQIRTQPCADTPLCPNCTEWHRP